jgi:hypothetical protein
MREGLHRLYERVEATEALGYSQHVNLSWNEEVARNFNLPHPLGFV